MKFKLWFETNEMVMPGLFEKLKQLRGQYSGVHFSKSDQLSYNLDPSHYDPIGIYIFPKEYVVEGKLKANQGFASYPYIFLIEATPAAKVLNLNMDYPQAEQLLEKIGIDKNLLYSPDVYHKGKNNTPGHRFWGVLEYIRNSQKLSKNMSWNTLLSKTGYNTLYDPGLGIIHWNEPTQIIFLSHNAYKVVDIIKNTNQYSLIKNFASFFPDFHMFKQRSGWSKDEYSLKLKKDGISISAWTSKYNPSQLAIKVYGFGDKYSSQEWRQEINSKEDLVKLVDEIKNFMQNTERTKNDYNEADYSIMKNISNMYNLKIDPEHPGVISKTYRDHTKFNLTYSPSSQTLHITISSSPLGLGRYIYYSDDVVVKDPQEGIQELIARLKQNIQKDIDDYKAHYHYDAPYAMKFADFLEKKVFVKRKKQF